MRYFLIILLALVAVASAGRQLNGKNRNLNTFPFNANQPSRRRLEAEARAGYGGHQRSYGYGHGGYGHGYGHGGYGHHGYYHFYGKRSADPEPFALADPFAAAEPAKFPFKTSSSTNQQGYRYGYRFGGNHGGYNGGQIGGHGYGKKTTNTYSKRFFGGNLLGRKKRKADSEAAADYQKNRKERSLQKTSFPFNTNPQRRTLNTFNSNRRNLVGTFPFNQGNLPAAGTRRVHGGYGGHHGGYGGNYGGHYGGHHGGYHGGYGHHGKRSAGPEPVAVADPVAAAGTFPFNADQQRRTLNTFNFDRRNTFPFNQRNQPAAGTRRSPQGLSGHGYGHGFGHGYGGQYLGKRSADPEPVAVADPVAGTFPFNTRTISSSTTNQQQGRHGGYGYTGYGHRYGYGLRGNQGGYNEAQNGGYEYGKKPTKRYSSRF